LPGRDPRAGYFIRGASPRIASSSSGEGSEDNLTFCSRRRRLAVGRLIDAACATSAERIEPPALHGSSVGHIQ
jgi:hypothetical protein